MSLFLSKAVQFNPLGFFSAMTMNALGHRNNRSFKAVIFFMWEYECAVLECPVSAAVHEPEHKGAENL